MSKKEIYSSESPVSEQLESGRAKRVAGGLAIAAVALALGMPVSPEVRKGFKDFTDSYPSIKNELIQVGIKAMEGLNEARIVKLAGYLAKHGLKVKPESAQSIEKMGKEAPAAKPKKTGQ